MVSFIPDREMVVIGGDLNCHAGTKRDGYEGINDGFEFGMRNSEAEILEFCNTLELTISNNIWMRGKEVFCLCSPLLQSINMSTI